MENKSKDFFAATTTDLELAGKLRHELLKSFSQLWICVINNRGTYRVNVSNVWGGRLEKSTEDSIMLFAQKYVDQHTELEEEKEEEFVDSLEKLKSVLTSAQSKEDE